MNVVAPRCLSCPHIFPKAYIDGREQDVKDGVGLIIRGQKQHKQVQEHGGSHSHRREMVLSHEGWTVLIIAAEEEEPYRHVQHKSFLTKIMFLCVVARPRYNTRKNTWFDGKI